MDKTETYVNMNDKLPEDFPDKYCVNFGDWYYDKHTKESHMLFESAFMIIYEAVFVKLHRQEQLQPMLGFGGSAIAILTFIKAFAISDQAVKEDWSIEQITLAAVMFKCYKRFWNGQRWVAI